MVTQYLQMNIGHITHLKNIDSYIKVSIIRKKDMQMILSMLITVNAEAIVPIMDKKFMGINKCNLRVYSKTFQLFITIEPRQNKKGSIHKFFCLLISETFRNKSVLL